MPTLRKRISGVLIGALFTLAGAGPALADDTEIYNTSASTAVNPNILFIVDTSGSMGTNDVVNDRKPYNSGTNYTTSNNCTAGRIFFRAEGEAQPDCKSTNYILASTTTNNCKLMTDAIAGISGRWTGKVGQFDNTAQVWRDLQPSGTSESIECGAESGKHGSTASPTPNVYARNGDKNNKWTSTASASIDWTQRKTYTFYGSNYLNWYRTTPADQTLSRITAVKQAVIDMASSVDGVNLGLMRYSNNDPNGSTDGSASGGYVAAAVADIDKNRANIISTVNGYSASGYTPLSETLWEAYRYYTGGAVDFGAASKPDVSVAASRVNGDINSTNYQSPMIGQCQKNFVIYLTDGLPTRDREADGHSRTRPARIKGLIGHTCLGPQVGDDNPDDGLCLDDLAGYMHQNDLIPDTTLTGLQTVETYTIGFGGDVKGATLLDDVAAAGGGKRFDASNTEQLTEALTQITNDVLNVSTTFTSASVGVNAFNRAQSRDELYFALFAPKETVRWEGNLKKFKLAVDKTTDPDNPVLMITGQGSTPTDAVDESTGRFKDSAQSFWSSENDGNDVSVGGVVEKLPASRTIYTFLGTNPAGSSTGNTLVALTDSTVTDTILGTASCTPSRRSSLMAVRKQPRSTSSTLRPTTAICTPSILRTAAASRSGPSYPANCWRDCARCT